MRMKDTKNRCIHNQMNRTPQIRMTERKNERTNERKSERTNEWANERTNKRQTNRSNERRTPTKWTAAECCLLIAQILLSSYISESRFFSMIRRLLLHSFSSSSCLLILQKNTVNSMSIWLDIMRVVLLCANGPRRSRGLYTRTKWINKCCSKLVYFLLLCGQLGKRYDNTTSVKAFLRTFLNEITKSKEEGM